MTIEKFGKDTYFARMWHNNKPITGEGTSHLEAINSVIEKLKKIIKA